MVKSLPAVAGGVNASRVRRLAGIAEVLVVAEIRRQVGLGVEAADRHSGNGGEAGVAVLVEVGAGGRADRLFGRLLERRRESFLRPLLFGGRRSAAVKYVRDRRFGDLPGFLSHVPPHRLTLDDRGGVLVRQGTEVKPTGRLVGFTLNQHLAQSTQYLVPSTHD